MRFCYEKATENPSESRGLDAAVLLAWWHKVMRKITTSTFDAFGAQVFASLTRCSSFSSGCCPRCIHPCGRSISLWQSSQWDLPASSAANFSTEFFAQTLFALCACNMNQSRTRSDSIIIEKSFALFHAELSVTQQRTLAEEGGVITDYLLEVCVYCKSLYVCMCLFCVCVFVCVCV